MCFIEAKHFWWHRQFVHNNFTYSLWVEYKIIVFVRRKKIFSESNYVAAECRNKVSKGKALYRRKSITSQFALDYSTIDFTLLYCRVILNVYLIVKTEISRQQRNRMNDERSENRCCCCCCWCVCWVRLLFFSSMYKLLNKTYAERTYTLIHIQNYYDLIWCGKLAFNADS